MSTAAKASLKVVIFQEHLGADPKEAFPMKGNFMRLSQLAATLLLSSIAFLPVHSFAHEADPVVATVGGVEIRTSELPWPKLISIRSSRAFPMNSAVWRR
jgi:hypothetical protein